MASVIIIGGGPGGYVCAIRAAQLGMQVTLVERARLGGTCLNVGCIPSKALLDSSERFHDATHGFAAHGIAVSPQLDVARMMARKQQVVDGLVQGITGLMKKHRVTVVAGEGRLVAAGRVQVGEQTLTADHVVLAMGSVPVALPILPVDGQRVVTSDHAIAFPAVPKRLVVVGGGVIGLELGSVWARLGAQVTVVEALPQICPFLDADVAKALQKSLSGLGIAFLLGHQVLGLADDGVRVRAPDGAEQVVAGERILVSVGRRPLSEGLDAAGVRLTERRRVAVDAQGRTNLANVWAIGDLVDGPMLAHKAEEEGIAVAERIAGQQPHLDHHLIPNVVYTEPEVASIGLSEAEAAKAGRPVRVGKFPFAANGRARAGATTAGFVKILADPATDRLLGAAVIGPRAADLIAIIGAHLAYGGSSEDIARTCLAHPTHGEAVKEAALDCLGRVLHT